MQHVYHCHESKFLKLSVVLHTRDKKNKLSAVVFTIADVIVIARVAKSWFVKKRRSRQEGESKCFK